MNNFIKNLKFEFKYLNKSRVILFFLVLVIVLVAFLSFADFQFMSDTYDNYQRQERFYQENGANIEEEIGKGYIFEGDRNNGTVENPIAYYHEQVGQAIYASSPQYAVAHILEFCMGAFPLMFGIFGAFLATTDYKNKMQRQRIIRYGRTSYYLTKAVTLLSFIVSMLILLILINELAGLFTYNCICNRIPVEKFNVPELPSKSNLIVKISIILLEGVTYGSIGFMLGNIFRNALISSIIVCLDSFIPIISNFEIINCFQYIIRDNFEFYGNISAGGCKDIDLVAALLIIFGTVVVTNAVSFILIKKRSAFN